MNRSWRLSNSQKTFKLHGGRSWHSSIIETEPRSITKIFMPHFPEKNKETRSCSSTARGATGKSGQTNRLARRALPGGGHRQPWFGIIPPSLAGLVHQRHGGGSARGGCGCWPGRPGTGGAEHRGQVLPAVRAGLTRYAQPAHDQRRSGRHPRAIPGVKRMWVCVRIVTDIKREVKNGNIIQFKSLRKVARTAFRSSFSSKVSLPEQRSRLVSLGWF